MVHNMFPLISQARPNIHLGHNPQPADGSITNVNDRFYQTFADIEFEDGDIKESIRNFIEEVQNPVKNVDKMKSIYDAIMKKLKEEKKKQLANPSQGLMVVGKQFTPPPSQERSSFLNVGLGAAASGGVSPPLGRFINQPFRSPNPQRYSDYSTNTNTPRKPLSKSERRPPPPEQSLEITGTPLRNPFNVNGPITSPLFSPPPPHQRANEENEIPQLLLSPGPAVRKITFDE